MGLQDRRDWILAVLDALAQRGDAAGRLRLLEAVGGDELSLRDRSAPLPEGALESVLAAVPMDRSLARRVGASLSRAEALGLPARFGRTGGWATPERALRQCATWLVRESGDTRIAAGPIGAGRAEIRVEGPLLAGPGRERSPLCGIREGMLAVMPALFGLPPARVQEVACRADGAPACRLRVQWSGGSRRGLWTGLGLGAAGGLGLAWVLGAGLPGGLAAAALGAGLLAGWGRAFDLSAQLDRVAGRKRAEVAWLDCTEQALAERMDELAKIDARRAEAEAPPAGDGDGAPAHRPPSRRTEADLASVVERALEAVRGEAGDRVEIDWLAPAEAPSLHCDAFQIEQMLVQLLRNGVRAAGARPEGGRVEVRVLARDEGLDLVVADDGAGIDPEVMDHVFDPFASTPVAGVDSGFGLPVSYRIAQAHGGELRVESEPDQGTRVVVSLPRAGRSGA